MVCHTRVVRWLWLRGGVALTVLAAGCTAVSPASEESIVSSGTKGDDAARNKAPDSAHWVGLALVPPASALAQTEAEAVASRILTNLGVRGSVVSIGSQVSRVAAVAGAGATASSAVLFGGVIGLSAARAFMARFEPATDRLGCSPDSDFFSVATCPFADLQAGDLVWSGARLEADDSVTPVAQSGEFEGRFVEYLRANPGATPHQALVGAVQGQPLGGTVLLATERIDDPRGLDDLGWFATGLFDEEGLSIDVHAYLQRGSLPSERELIVAPIEIGGVWYFFVRVSGPLWQPLPVERWNPTQFWASVGAMSAAAYAVNGSQTRSQAGADFGTAVIDQGCLFDDQDLAGSDLEGARCLVRRAIGNVQGREVDEADLAFFAQRLKVSSDPDEVFQKVVSIATREYGPAAWLRAGIVDLGLVKRLRDGTETLFLGDTYALVVYRDGTVAYLSTRLWRDHLERRFHDDKKGPPDLLAFARVLAPGNWVAAGAYTLTLDNGNLRLQSRDAPEILAPGASSLGTLVRPLDIRSDDAPN